MRAAWDHERAERLCKDAIARLAEHYADLSAAERDALDLTAQDVWHGRMLAAGLDGDTAAFEEALEGWEQAGLEALRAVRGEPLLFSLGGSR